MGGWNQTHLLGKGGHFRGGWGIFWCNRSILFFILEGGNLGRVSTLVSGIGTAGKGSIWLLENKAVS